MYRSAIDFRPPGMPRRSFWPHRGHRGCTTASTRSWPAIVW